MKINKLKIISIAIYYFAVSLLSEAQCMEQDTITMKSGASLQVPTGFQVKQIEPCQIIKIEDPDNLIDTYLIETEGNDLKMAIQDGWKRVSPSFDQKISQLEEPPAPFGYDKIVVQNYVSDKETLVQAHCQSKDNWIWVFLVSGPMANIIKRSSQLISFIGSLKAQGVVEEDLIKKPLISLKENQGQFEQFIIQAKETLGVPGLSIVIVENGEVIFENGYGVKKIGEKDQVNGHTQMKIGSITKSMTTLLMAQLIEEGRFNWDTKAIELYPIFQVGDEKLTKTMNMEQMASASTGLPRKDFPMILNYRGQNAFQQLATTKPTTKDKETFQYNNQLLTAAGQIAAHTVYPKETLDQAFCHLMPEKIFQPLGMKNSTFVPKENYALPHSKAINGDNKVLALHDDEYTDFQKPAGGVWSSANDMGLYLIAELKGGINSVGDRVFDEHNLMHRRVPQIKVAHNIHYGLGWSIGKYKQLIEISHGGGTLGFGSLLKFYPDKQCGYVLLTNVGGINGHTLNDVIDKKLQELWFGTDEKSSQKLGFYLQLIKKNLDDLKEELSEPCSKWMDTFVGKHENVELGIIEIQENMGNYTLDINGIYKTRLMVRNEKNGDKTITWIEPPHLRMSLMPIDGGTFKLMEDQHSYTFNRIA